MQKSQIQMVKKLKEEDERLRQRIAALRNRIRRYKNTSKSRREESVFSTDQKSFYQLLDQDNQQESQKELSDKDVMSRFDNWLIAKNVLDT